MAYYVIVDSMLFNTENISFISKGKIISYGKSIKGIKSQLSNLLKNRIIESVKADQKVNESRLIESYYILKCEDIEGTTYAKVLKIINSKSEISINRNKNLKDFLTDAVSKYLVLI